MKCSSQPCVSASPRKSSYKLGRSASFSSDPVFKVPPVPQKQPQRRPSFSTSNSRPSWESCTDQPQQPQRPSQCPNCCQSEMVTQQRPHEWKSRSLVDLQPQRPPRGQQSSASQHPTETASIFSNNLRSNSWRNLSLIGKNDSTGAIFNFKIISLLLIGNEDG